VEASRQGALHIPKDAPDQREVSFARVMHEEAHLLYSIGQVGASERQVLERAGETPVRAGISDRGARRGRELGTRVNRCRCRVTLGHARLLKKVHGVLPLAEEKAVGGASDGYT
jgi:hypothetical protein